MSQFISFLCLIGFCSGKLSCPKETQWRSPPGAGGDEGQGHSRRLGTTHDNFLNLRALMSSKIDGRQSQGKTG